MKKILQSIHYGLLYSTFFLLSLLPLRALYVLSDIFYFFVYVVGRYRRKVVRHNLLNSFPDRTPSERLKIEKQFYSNLCDYFVELLKMTTISREEISRRMRFEGFETLQPIIEEGKSVGFYLAHVFNWEWISSLPLHAEGADERLVFGQIYHRLASPAFNKLMLRIRGRFGAENIAMPDTARAMMTYKKNKRTAVIGFIADQAPKLHMIEHWLEFLHQDTAVITGTERLMKKLDYVAVFCSVERVKRGYYVCKISAPILNARSLPEFELTDTYYKFLDDCIQRNPASWLWSHKRWKRTRAEFEDYQRTHAKVHHEEVPKTMNNIPHVQLSIIVAATENNVIGAGNKMPWHLPNDLKWFKTHTYEHSVIMGRKTYESLGKPLPNRRNIVITRNADFKAEGCEIASSLEEAIQMVDNEYEAFVIGGGELYRQAWTKATRLYLTRIHTTIEGDTSIPEVREQDWEEHSAEAHHADEKHPFDYTFKVYRKK